MTAPGGYSRPLALDYPLQQIQPGDLVDLANDGAEPYWVTVVTVGACGVDPDDDSDHCDRDGGCLGVLTLEPVEPGDPRWWHVQAPVESDDSRWWHGQPGDRLIVRVPCVAEAVGA